MNKIKYSIGCWCTFLFPICSFLKLSDIKLSSFSSAHRLIVAKLVNFLSLLGQTHHCGPRTTFASGWSGPLKSTVCWRSTQPCSRTQMVKSCAKWARRTSSDWPACTTPKCFSLILITSGKVSTGYNFLLIFDFFFFYFGNKGSEATMMKVNIVRIIGPWKNLLKNRTVSPWCVRVHVRVSVCVCACAWIEICSAIHILPKNLQQI